MLINKKNVFVFTLIMSLIIVITYCLFYLFQKAMFTDFVAVLLYHDIDVIENENKYWHGNFVSLNKFKEQMLFLKRHHYKTITLDELYNFVRGEKRLPKRSVLITFDGGRKTIFKNAYPILKDLDFHASLFVLAGKIESDKENYMSREEMEKISDVFEFASHTYDLHYLKERKNFNSSAILTTPSEDIKNDIRKSMDYVNKQYFAYPYGRYNDNVISALKESGIKAAFITGKGKIYVGDSLYELKRNTITNRIKFKKFLETIGYQKRTLKNLFGIID